MLGVTARTIDSGPVEEGDIRIGGEDTGRWSLSRHTERKAAADRVFAVRPLIQRDDLVPELGLVHRLAHIEPRGRHERPVLALIRPLHAVLRLEWSTPAEHVARGRTRRAGARQTPTSAAPGAGQVRLSVRQPWRRNCRRISLRSAAAAAAEATLLRSQGGTDDAKDCRRAREKPRPGDLVPDHRRILTFQPF